MKFLKNWLLLIPNIPIIAICKYNNKVVNGTHLWILELHKNILKYKIISDYQFNSNIVCIIYTIVSTSEEDNYFILKYKQFPVTPVFAIIIDTSHR